MATGEKMVIVRLCNSRMKSVAMDVLCRMGRGGEVSEVGEGEDSGREVEEGGEGAGLAGEAGAEKGEDVGDVAVDVGIVEE